MADPPPISDSLQRMIDDLKISIENKSDSVFKIVQDILALINENGIESVPDVSMVPCVQLVLLLRWKSNEVVASVANVLAEVAKSGTGRERLATLQPPIAQQLVNLLQQKSTDLSQNGSLPVVTQVCRALGNMCYESERGQKCVWDADGLGVLLTTLERAIQLGGESAEARTLRSVIVGCLLNLTVSQPDKHKILLNLGGTALLCRVLSLDGVTDEGVDTASHILIILGFLADQGGDNILIEEACQTLVNVLASFSASSLELSEDILELLHGHAEDDSVKLYLARAGLCQLLVKLLEKHRQDLDKDEDAQDIFKMATDLIVIILNGDEGMSFLYKDGKGELYHSMLKWLHSKHLDLQTTGVLSIGNFARCDAHCTKMVKDGVHRELLALLEQNSKTGGDVRMQHAVLSALRNIAIPTPNKAVLLNEGVLQALTTKELLCSSTLLVVFKLLATLRMLVDGQESAATELGTNKDLIAKLVEWSSNDCHVGVQGEASRLIAWLVKNSRTSDVVAAVLEAGALPPLVSMLISEHAVMRNEALLALTIVAAMHLSKAQPSLAEAKVGAKVAALLTEHGTSMEKAMLCNVLSLLGELVTSDMLVKHLAQAGVTESLSGLTSTRKDISDLDGLVLKLSTALNTTSI